MSGETKPRNAALSRREVMVAAGAAAVVAYFPFAGAAPAVGTTRGCLLADWSIDDQWGVYPRYDAIPCTPRQSDDARLAAVHPADAAFLA